MGLRNKTFISRSHKKTGSAQKMKQMVHLYSLYFSSDIINNKQYISILFVTLCSLGSRLHWYKHSWWSNICHVFMAMIIILFFFMCVSAVTLFVALSHEMFMKCTNHADSTSLTSLYMNTKLSEDTHEFKVLCHRYLRQIQSKSELSTCPIIHLSPGWLALRANPAGAGGRWPASPVPSGLKCLSQAELHLDTMLHYINNR